MIKEIIQLIKCKKEWEKLNKKYGFDQFTLVILMLQKNEELNSIVAKYLTELEERRKSKRTVILTDNESSFPRDCKSENRMVIEISKKQIRSLLRLYQMHKFSKYFIVVSLTEPQCNTGEELLGLHGITQNDLVRACILSLPLEV